MEAFCRFQEECKHPMVYNGDISQDTLLSQSQATASSPNLGEQPAGAVVLPMSLKGVMIGRGLLARPWITHTPPPCGSPSPNLGEEQIMIADPSPKLREEIVRHMHERIYRYAVENLCGDSQILSRLHAFWEYLDIPHKLKKAIMKATTLPRYREAVATVTL